MDETRKHPKTMVKTNLKSMDKTLVTNITNSMLEKCLIQSSIVSGSSSPDSKIFYDPSATLK